MLPKPGDQVTLDPWYEDQMRDAMAETNDTFADGVFGVPLKVVHTVVDGPWLVVTVSDPRIRTFYIDKETGRWHAGDQLLAPPLFMPAIEYLAKVAMASSELKVRNTDPEAQTCTKCGDALKDPVPGVPIFRHCPMCDP
jgi:hypothetical protein